MTYRLPALARFVAIPVLVAVALLGFLVGAPIAGLPIRLDVGAEGPFRAPDETDTVRRMAGFHEPEIADGVSFRWTKHWARLIFPNVHRLGERQLLEIGMCGCRPAGEQPSVQLNIDNRPVAVLQTGGVYRRYRVAVPPGGGNAGDLFVELRAPVAMFAGRLVGARVDRLEVHALGSRTIGWPVASALALFGGMVALAVLWLGRGNATHTVLLASLALGPAAILGFYRPQELLPETLICASIAGVLFAALARPNVPGVVLLGGLAIALPLVSQWLGGWMIDDAFISFRYARNLVEGYGLVFNPGERVEGYTNFLWTIGMSGVLRLGGDPVYLAQVTTLLLGLAIVALTFVLARQVEPGARSPEQGSRGAGFVPFAFSLFPSLTAVLLLVTSSPFLLYSIRGSGMETALFTLLALVGIVAYLAAIDRATSNEQRPTTDDRPAAHIIHPSPIPYHLLVLAGLCFGLAAMTRPEGVLLAGLTGLHLVVTQMYTANKRHNARFSSLILHPSSFILHPSSFALGFLAVFGPYYLWRFSYYGLPLPNTFYVKVGATEAQVWRGARYLAEYWAAEGWAWAAGLVLILALAFIRHPKPVLPLDKLENRVDNESKIENRKSKIQNPKSVFLLLLVLGYQAYIVAVGGDWIPGARFVVPIVPLLAVLGAAGLAAIARRGRWWATLALALLALALFDHTGGTLTTRASDPANLIWRENDVVARRREVGRWLDTNTPASTLVAVEAAGALPYYSRRPTIDILGLNDRHIATLEVPTIGQGKPGHEKTDIPYVLDRQPDIIPYFAATYFGGDPRFEQGYAREEHDGPEGYTVVIYRRKN